MRNTITTYTKQYQPKGGTAQGQLNMQYCEDRDYD